MGFLFNIAQDIAASLDSWTNKSLSGFCHLESNYDETTLIADDCSLVSAFDLGGFLHMDGQLEREQAVKALSHGLSASFRSSGHALQFFFSRNPGQTRELIDNHQQSARYAATQLQLDLERNFQERAETYAGHAVAEDACLVLWSRPALLSVDELKANKKDRERRNKGLPHMPDSIFPGGTLKGLINLHKATAEQLVDDCRAAGIAISPLPVTDFLRVIKTAIEPEGDWRSWTPRLPGSKPQCHLTSDLSDKDVSDLLWPRLSTQLFDADAEVKNTRQVQIGETLFAPIDVLVVPEEIQGFNRLLGRVRDHASGIPWRVCFLLEGGGAGDLGLKQALAGLLRVASMTNQQIHEAGAELRDRLKKDETLIRLRITFTTWAPADQADLLSDRAATLRKAVEGWGSANVSQLTRDPLEAVLGSVPGLACSNTAPVTVAPLSETLAMLPLFRPVSPWTQGNPLFVTADRRIFPVQEGSALQTRWISLLYGPPGHGKSVLLNLQNLAVLLSPGTGGSRQLPRIAIVDIGPTSEGLVSLVRESLPASRRHEAAYFAIRNDPRYSINPFDTRLGLRKPLSFERSFVVNFLNLLCTPPAAVAPYDGIADLIGTVVDKAYEYFGDEGRAKLYQPKLDREVDETLEQHAIPLEDRPTWWEVVDALYGAGQYRVAALAQRYAVPVLADLVTISRDRAIEDMYGPKKAPTGESIIQAFQILVNSALREYLVLGNPTAFDLRGARLVSLDLSEVSGGKSEAGKKQTAVFYMLAMNAVSADYFASEETVKAAPEKYRDYHQTLLRADKENHKRLVFDEFHRTGGIGGLRDYIVFLMREGRKYGIQLSLASQFVTDFDKDMVEQATSIWALGYAKEMRGIFDLTQEEDDLGRMALTGPAKRGTPALAIFRTKLGTYRRLIYLPVGPEELWALSTTTEDVALRRQLYEKIGPVWSRRLLARRFPGGTAKDEIEKRIRQRFENGVTDTTDESLIQEIAGELTRLYSDHLGADLREEGGQQ